SAQDGSGKNGKILRINLDGSIPSDNPVVNNPVWSLGHRNAQGLTANGNRLYASEHGPESDDEINIIEKGRNYGWPQVKGLCNETSEQVFCSANNVAQPIKTWTPTAAVCGLEFYNADAIPQWKNSLLLATLKNSRLYQLKLSAGGTEVVETNEFFNGVYGRMRDLCVAPDGKVYICTGNGSNDKIIVVSGN
ncbi:MAG: PQQ-dependent sugar dehydrogenase, partial [Chitinophagaceae bacterium]